MSIASLCTGDQVVIQTPSTTVGDTLGADVSYSNAAAATECLIQTVSASEDTSYAARNQRLTHQAFFSSDVSLGMSKRLKWTVEAGATLSTARYLRVLDYYSEGRPGSNLLWVADLEEVAQRFES